MNYNLGIACPGRLHFGVDARDSLLRWVRVGLGLVSGSLRDLFLPFLSTKAPALRVDFVLTLAQNVDLL